MIDKKVVEYAQKTILESLNQTTEPSFDFSIDTPRPNIVFDAGKQFVKNTDTVIDALTAPKHLYDKVYKHSFLFWHWETIHFSFNPDSLP